ncbi:unnamed protein product [Strongylus vulgaris]|uniref:Uncharacterized protein n=1 Tax=Strongylus vulgaris TaxID=40348 RepID=A0A3P7J150_STRVU|nr:unnamed protein product [Strongylus vulgaris]
MTNEDMKPTNDAELSPRDDLIKVGEGNRCGGLMIGVLGIERLLIFQFHPDEELTDEPLKRMHVALLRLRKHQLPEHDLKVRNDYTNMKYFHVLFYGSSLHFAQFIGQLMKTSAVFSSFYELSLLD